MSTKQKIGQGGGRERETYRPGRCRPDERGGEGQGATQSSDDACQESSGPQWSPPPIGLLGGVLEHFQFAPALPEELQQQISGEREYRYPNRHDDDSGLSALRGTL